jgi:hypothetical protein
MPPCSHANLATSKARCVASSWARGRNMAVAPTASFSQFCTPSRRYSRWRSRSVRAAAAAGRTATKSRLNTASLPLAPSALARPRTARLARSRPSVATSFPAKNCDSNPGRTSMR